ncbi:septal ring lytic transglycosylase RlpA family protein [Arboricoccus pini]|nr:septal ring lytic transglycosylase RlpA family protein [Arboricoccus pini]
MSMVAVLSGILITPSFAETASGDRNADNDGFSQVGKASWYGPGLHGRQTASGDSFDQNALTAAHRRLPLGSTVMVTNLQNGRSVTVLINDRGPFVPGRVIDLSRAAARDLGMTRSGVARVRIERVDEPSSDDTTADASNTNDAGNLPAF